MKIMMLTNVMPPTFEQKSKYEIQMCVCAYSMDSSKYETRPLSDFHRIHFFPSLIDWQSIFLNRNRCEIKQNISAFNWAHNLFVTAVFQIPIITLTCESLATQLIVIAPAVEIIITSILIYSVLCIWVIMFPWQQVSSVECISEKPIHSNFTLNSQTALNAIRRVLYWKNGQCFMTSYHNL